MAEPSETTRTPATTTATAGGRRLLWAIVFVAAMLAWFLITVGATMKGRWLALFAPGAVCLAVALGTLRQLRPKPSPRDARRS